MAIDFPTSPSEDDEYSYEGRTWIFTAQGAWKLLPAVGPAGATGPEGPTGPEGATGATGPAGEGAEGARFALPGDSDYYVDAATGNDGNDGSPGTPWASLQFAADFIAGSLDVAAHTVIVHIVDGTYGQLRITPWVGGGVVLFQGNTTDPNVILDVTSDHAIITQGAISGTLQLQGLTVKTTTDGCGISHQAVGAVELLNMFYDDCAAAHIRSNNDGCTIICGNGYSIIGDSPIHWHAIAGTIKGNGVNIDLVGAPTFADAFVSTVPNAYVEAYGLSFTGSAVNGGTGVLWKSAGTIATDLAQDAWPGDEVYGYSYGMGQYGSTGNLDTPYFKDYAVTFPKLRQVDVPGVVGRLDAGTGDLDLITLAQLREAIAPVVQLYTATQIALIDDAYNTVEMLDSAPLTYEIPPSSDVAFPLYCVINVVQTGTGQVTIAPGAGVGVNSKDGNLNLAGQFSAVTLYQTAIDVWIVFGDLVA